MCFAALNPYYAGQYHAAANPMITPATPRSHRHREPSAIHHLGMHAEFD
jgi:hypothetical protein